jgi:lipopolysaccharide/colanic/teichoic acid biosynthesis glycosyltransferase
MTASWKAVKRAIDIVGGLAGVCLFCLLFPAIWLAIRLSSPGPCFFVQERAGEDGRPFRCYKFRSMRNGTCAPIVNGTDSLLRRDDDPRVTSVGLILRKTSLDELPQFINVLRGQMSLVGPRPRPLNEHDELSLVGLHGTKPGITGPSQVRRLKRFTTHEERVALDSSYSSRSSFCFDLMMIGLTFRALWRKRGMY